MQRISLWIKPRLSNSQMCPIEKILKVSSVPVFVCVCCVGVCMRMCPRVGVGVRVFILSFPMAPAATSRCLPNLNYGCLKSITKTTRQCYVWRSQTDIVNLNYLSAKMLTELVCKTSSQLQIRPKYANWHDIMANPSTDRNCNEFKRITHNMLFNIVPFAHSFARSFVCSSRVLYKHGHLNRPINMYNCTGTSFYIGQTPAYVSQSFPF